jgi:hypothetical protein
MTITDIVASYLLENGFDGLHSHPTNDNYGGCGCSVKDLFSCKDAFADCIPAYKHTKQECRKCPDFKECKPFDDGEKFMFCGKEKNAL